MDSWISCKDRLPGNGQRVIFYGVDFEEDCWFACCGHYNRDRHVGWYADDGSVGYRKVNSEYVQFWMPMPALPDERKPPARRKEGQAL